MTLVAKIGWNMAIMIKNKIVIKISSGHFVLPGVSWEGRSGGVHQDGSGATRHLKIIIDGS